MNEQKPPKAIEWTRITKPDGTRTRGFTWNPVSGCQHACRWTMPDGAVAECYAENVAEGIASQMYPQGFGHHYWNPERLEEPLRQKQPSGIFVGSMADLFGHWVPDEQIEMVLDVCRRAHWHTFFVLTKNAPRLAKFEFPDNVWVGASSPPDFMFGKQLNREQQERMLHKILKTLSGVKAKVRWISAEPLSWDISNIVAQYPDALQWLVVGGASDGAREFPPSESDLIELLTVLDEQGVPVFFKGNLHTLPYADQHWREGFPGVPTDHLIPPGGTLVPPSAPPTIDAPAHPAPALPRQAPMFSIESPAWVALLPPPAPMPYIVPTVDGDRQVQIVVHDGAFVLHATAGGTHVLPDHWTITHADSRGAFVQAIPGRAAAERLLYALRGIDMTGYVPQSIDFANPPDIIKPLFAALRIWAAAEGLRQFEPTKLPRFPLVPGYLPAPAAEPETDEPVVAAAVTEAVTTEEVAPVVEVEAQKPPPWDDVSTEQYVGMVNAEAQRLDAEPAPDPLEITLAAIDGWTVPEGEIIPLLHKLKRLATDQSIVITPLVTKLRDLDIDSLSPITAIAALFHLKGAPFPPSKPAEPVTEGLAVGASVRHEFMRIDGVITAELPTVNNVRFFEVKDAAGQTYQFGEKSLTLVATAKLVAPAADANEYEWFAIGDRAVRKSDGVEFEVTDTNGDLISGQRWYGVPKADLVRGEHKVLEKTWTETTQLEVIENVHRKHFRYPDAGELNKTTPAVQAFSAQQIVAAVQGALRSRAITETWTFTTMGRIYLKDAAHIRWNAEANQAEVLVGDSWVRVTTRGIGRWAQAEHLNWHRDDGSIWLHDQDVMTLPGEEPIPAAPPVTRTIPRISIDDVPDGAMVLSLWQPWASLIFCPPDPDPLYPSRMAAKEIETRHWKPNQKLPITLVIHAAKTQQEMNLITDPIFRRALARGGFENSGGEDLPIPFGAAIGVVDLVEVVPISVGFRAGLHSEESRFGNYSTQEQRYAWVLRNPRMFDKPIPMKGQQGMWKWERPGAVPVPAVITPPPATTQRVIRVQDAPAGWERNPSYVYVGRRMGGNYKHLDQSPFANPRLPLPEYRTYMLGRLHADPFLRKMLDQLKGKTLVCWCKNAALPPEQQDPCHADILCEWIDNGIPALDDPKPVAVETPKPAATDEPRQLTLFDLPEINTTAKSSFAA